MNDDTQAKFRFSEDTYAEWLFAWFLHFQENEHYEAYCDAKRKDDRATCAKLENEFDQIARLYRDWGDIYFLDDATEITTVELWGFPMPPTRSSQWRRSPMPRLTGLVRSCRRY